MGRSAVIIIKCPACAEKFQADRLEETSYVSCPECGMQVKISGTQDRSRRSVHALPQAAALPAKRQETRISFKDLSKGDHRTPRVNLAAVDKEATERGYLTKKVLAQRTTREAFDLHEEDVLEDLAVPTDPAFLAEFPVPEEPAASETPDGVPAQQQELTFEKIQVSSSGERRVLREAPKADVPEPKPKGLAGIEVMQRPEDEKLEPPQPTQEFDDLRISEGAEWRRHKPQREDDPDWEDENRLRKALIPTRRKRIGRWLGVAAAVLFGLGAIALLLRTMFPGAHTQAAQPAEKAPPKPAPLTVTEMYPTAEKNIRAFLEASSNEEALQYVRDAGRVALRMKRFYPSGEFSSTVGYKIAPFDLAKEHDGYLHLPISFKDGGDREISLDLRTGKIDWESWVGYCLTPFIEFRDRRIALPTQLRVFMADDDYYNFEFVDREKHRSVRLYSADEKESLWGYFRKDSPAYREAGHHLVGAANDLPTPNRRHAVIIKARFPEKTANPDRDQVEITDFIKMGWVLPEENGS